MADKPKVENRRSAKEAESHGPAMSRAGSTALMHGFTVTARELGKLHVHGDPAGCKEALERLGGVKGLATKLCTSLLTGLPEGDEEVSHRQEAYVVLRDVATAHRCFATARRAIAPPHCSPPIMCTCCPDGGTCHLRCAARLSVGACAPS
jgi:hypothetical protein